MSHRDDFDDFSDAFPMNEDFGGENEELKAEFDVGGHATEETIYAWLDEALDDVESAKVEQHVEACDTCSAAVAEARGVIAASTRIISSLDLSPKNIVPKEDVARTAARIVAAADATIVSPRSIRTKAIARKLPWYRHSAFRIAAGIVVMLGGATYVVNANRTQSIFGVRVMDAKDAVAESKAAPPEGAATAPATTSAVTSAPLAAAPVDVPAKPAPVALPPTASGVAALRGRVVGADKAEQKAREPEQARMKDVDIAKSLAAVPPPAARKASADANSALQTVRCLVRTPSSLTKRLLRELQGPLGATGDYTLTIVGWPTVASRTVGAFVMEQGNHLHAIVERDANKLDIDLRSDGDRWTGRAISTIGKDTQEFGISFSVETSISRCER